MRMKSREQGVEGGPNPFLFATFCRLNLDNGDDEKDGCTEQRHFGGGRHFDVSDALNCSVQCQLAFMGKGDLAKGNRCCHHHDASGPLFRCASFSRSHLVSA